MGFKDKRVLSFSGEINIIKPGIIKNKAVIPLNHNEKIFVLIF